MTNDATGERPGNPELPPAPIGEAAALVARLLSEDDQHLSAAEGPPFSMALAERGPDDSDSTRTGRPSAGLPANRNDRAVRPGPSARAPLPYSNTRLSLIIVALSVLIFGSGLAVGYGVFGPHSKSGGKSNVEGAKPPAIGNSMRPETTDNHASVPNQAVAPAANLPNTSTASPTEDQAEVLHDKGGGIDSGVPANVSVLGTSLASSKADPGAGNAMSAEPVSSAPSRATPSDTTETLKASAQPSLLKARDVPATAASSGTESNAAQTRLVLEKPPEEARVPGEAPSERIDPCQLVHSVQPVYPQKAKKLHVEGNVELRVVVGQDGSVGSVGLVSGPPLLVMAAINAARQFRYTPALLNGQPIEAVETIDMSFQLKK